MLRGDEFVGIKESLFIILGAIGALIYKFLGWIMPKTYEIFFNHFKQIINEDVNKELASIKQMLAAYKDQKHQIEGENLNLKQAIKEAKNLEELKEITKDDDII